MSNSNQNTHHRQPSYPSTSSRSLAGNSEREIFRPVPDSLKNSGLRFNTNTADANMDGTENAEYFNNENNARMEFLNNAASRRGFGKRIDSAFDQINKIKNRVYSLEMENKDLKLFKVKIENFLKRHFKAEWELIELQSGPAVGLTSDKLQILLDATVKAEKSTTTNTSSSSTATQATVDKVLNLLAERLGGNGNGEKKDPEKIDE